MEPATVSLAKFQELSSISRTTMYRMLADGDIKSVRINGRRLILWSSYLALVEKARKLEAAAE